MYLPQFPFNQYSTLQAFAEEYLQEQSSSYIKNIIVEGLNILAQGWIAHVSENYTDINAILVCGPADRGSSDAHFT